MLEKFGAKVRDVQISDKIAKLAKELETKELDLAAQAISAEIALIEIPAANQASGEQDAFELFARDFLDSLWFRIEQGPGRGADAGRDLIAIGRKPSTQSQQEIKWLVSCKHFAHSSNERSVSLKDEINIPTRVLQAECDAFMGFLFHTSIRRAYKSTGGTETKRALWKRLLYFR